MTLDQYFKELGFLESLSKACMYMSAIYEVTIIGVYVYDIVNACKNEKIIKKFKRCICKKFGVKDLGKLHHFLGIKI